MGIRTTRNQTFRTHDGRIIHGRQAELCVALMDEIEEEGGVDMSTGLWDADCSLEAFCTWPVDRDATEEEREAALREAQDEGDGLGCAWEDVVCGEADEDDENVEPFCGFRRAWNSMPAHHDFPFVLMDDGLIYEELPDGRFRFVFYADELQRLRDFPEWQQYQEPLLDLGITEDWRRPYWWPTSWADDSAPTLERIAYYDRHGEAQDTRFFARP